MQKPPKPMNRVSSESHLCTCDKCGSTLKHSGFLAFFGGCSFVKQSNGCINYRCTNWWWFNETKLAPEHRAAILRVHYEQG